MPSNAPSHSAEADLVVIGLTTRLGACVDAVRDRRLSRGDAPDFDPGNTIDRARRCARGVHRLKAAEVTVLMLSRAEALAWCREKLLQALKQVAQRGSHPRRAG